jgi:hypothetical protein
MELLECVYGPRHGSRKAEGEVGSCLDLESGSIWTGGKNK